MIYQKRKLGDIFLLLTALLVFLFFSFGIWLDTSPRFSENDNRHLTPPPSFSSFSELLGAFGNGNLSEDISAFYSDRLPLRAALLGLRSRSELFFGKREVNGIIIDSSGILYQTPVSDTALLQKNLTYIEGFSSSAKSASLPTTLLCIPDRLTMTDDDGLAIRTYRERADLAGTLLKSYEGIPLLDPHDRLKSSLELGEEVYFSTDHHLTAYGAYLVYREYISDIGMSPISKNVLTSVTISEKFLGSLHSRLCMTDGISPDKLSLLRYDGDESYTLSFHDTSEVKNSFYDLSAIEKKDKYSVFLGGNYGRVSVKGEGERQRLLIIKDSYANAMLPFLAYHFDLDVIDLRYYPEDLSSLMESEDYDRVLIIYGINTLSTDISPRRLALADISS